MKTKEELNAMKEEVETMNKKLADLTEEELAQVSGGGDVPRTVPVIELPVNEPPVNEPPVIEPPVNTHCERHYDLFLSERPAL